MKILKKTLLFIVSFALIITFMTSLSPQAANRPAVPTVYSLRNEIEGLKISWTRAEGATEGYRIYRHSAGESWTYLTTTKSTTYFDKNVTDNEYWTYTVRATNGKVYSNYNRNNPVRKRLATSYVTSITNQANGIEIKWNNVPGASYYKIYRRGAGQSWEFLTNVNIKHTKYTDASIKENYGEYYRYCIRAVCGDSWNAYESGKYIKRQSVYLIPVTEEDIHTMAKLVYLEARGECYEGQVAVAETVVNRVLSKNFPNTVNGVVYQSGQFTPAHRIPYTTARQEQYDAVYDALTGNGVLNNKRVVYFAMGSCCGTYYTTIGCHMFGYE